MIVLVMGTTGSGKTTIGKLLAGRLNWEFLDGDDFHPPANIEKMRAGIPLTDADRAPWLQILGSLIIARLGASESAVLACSALKESYRKELLVDSRVRLIYLRGSYELFSERVRGRTGHFAKQDLLASQFATLEEPADAIAVDATQSPDQIVAEILQRLGIR